MDLAMVVLARVGRPSQSPSDSVVQLNPALARLERLTGRAAETGYAISLRQLSIALCGVHHISRAGRCPRVRMAGGRSPFATEEHHHDRFHFTHGGSAAGTTSAEPGVPMSLRCSYPYTADSLSLSAGPDG